MRPGSVAIADKDKVINGLVTFDLQLDGLPEERIAAYTLPLGSIALILGPPGWFGTIRVRIGKRSRMNSLAMDAVVPCILGSSRRNDAETSNSPPLKN